MSFSPPRPARKRLPEIELQSSRLPELGYEAANDAGLVRCIEHGFPTPLARWHAHDDFELHLIVATSGNAFVGDWIGTFAPGHLVLCGARLPHNWISLDAPIGGVERRDLAIQFLPDPIFAAAETFSELHEAARMLRRACHGIEFFGMAEVAEQSWRAIKATQGLKRFRLFCDFLAELSQCTDYRLLSSANSEHASDSDLRAIQELVGRIAANPSATFTAAIVAAELGMNTGRFGRLFKRFTGASFPGHVNQVRVMHACQLLMQTNQYVTSICYAAGFNNVANFNRQFLGLKGVTPSEFRRQSHLRFAGSSCDDDCHSRGD